MSIRVLVVDDSPTMRRHISHVLRADPAIQVVGDAADPHEARLAIKQLHPDVITLDIEMPNMNGLDFLEIIMRLRPTPVIMVSSLTQAGSEISLRALEIGAFDCVGKPSSLGDDNFETLADKVKAAARSKRLRGIKPLSAHNTQTSFVPDGRLVTIGASTGGVEALIEILSQFPENCPPTIISQHMPASFIPSFANRLNRICPASVAPAIDGAVIKPGQIYLAPGDAHLEVCCSTQWHCRLNMGERVNGHRPSVDIMFQSVARICRTKALGVILTGMGRDGAEGLLAMRKAGAETIGQDEASSVVYGMPKAAFKIGAVGRQLPLERISSQILHSVNHNQRESL